MTNTLNTQVLDYFPQFTDKFEGRTGFMYLDVLCLVTTGRGNLIDPVATAIELRWLRRSDHQRASVGEVVTEWNRVKALTALAPHGGWAFAESSTLFLDDKAIDDLDLTKMMQVWAYLCKRFPDLPDCPADAQLGCLSMAWAMGPAFNFPKFDAAVLAKDWATCQAECQMSSKGNPGLVPRNIANRILFGNAGCTPDPATLYYPVVLETSF